MISTNRCIYWLVVGFNSVMILHLCLIVGYIPLVGILWKYHLLILLSPTLIFKYGLPWRLVLNILVLVIKSRNIYHWLLINLLLWLQIVLSLTVHWRERLVSNVWYSMAWIIKIAIIHLLIILETWC